MPLPLTLAVANYDRILALALGDVRPEGIDLNVLRLTTPEIFARADDHEFHACEFSVAKYMDQRVSGDDRYQALPVFVARYFRHWTIYVNNNAGIREPADLRGKRVGVTNFRFTSSVYARAVLQHEFGVHASEMRWVQTAPVAPPRDPAVQLETLKGADLSKMLIKGELDALVAPFLPAAMRDPNVPVRRLLPNYKELERAFYQKTGIFPQMHTIVLRRDVLDRDPWVARSLYKAFCQARDWALERVERLQVSLPWLQEAVEETRALMGSQYWPYGLEANRAGLELTMQYLLEQSLIDHLVPIDEIFLALN